MGGSVIKCVGVFASAAIYDTQSNLSERETIGSTGLPEHRLFAYELCRSRSRDYMGGGMVFYMHWEGYLILIMMSICSQLKTLSAVSFWVLFLNGQIVAKWIIQGPICVLTSWRLLGEGHPGKNIPFNQAIANSKSLFFGSHWQKSVMRLKWHIWLVNELNWLAGSVLGKWEIRN